MFGEEFDEAIKGLRLNDVSKIVELDSSFHIIKVTEYQEAEILSFDEIKESTCYNFVSKTNDKLVEFSKGKTKLQVNPRLINLFYIKNNLRSRIEKNGLVYKVLGSETSFSKDEIIKEIKNHPERFSPNVLIRPLYQETILPNLAYVGGGSEIAYWLQLKDYFEKKNITFIKRRTL